MLNSADKLFAELRDSSFAAVGPSLGEKAKAIQTNYQAGALMCHIQGSISGTVHQPLSRGCTVESHDCEAL